MSRQPVADLVIAAKTLFPCFRSSPLPHLSTIVSVFLSSISSHPFINTSIPGTVEVMVSVICTN